MAPKGRVGSGGPCKLLLSWPRRDRDGDEASRGSHPCKAEVA